MADTWDVAEFAQWLSLQEIPKRKMALNDLTSARLKRYNEWRTFEEFYQAHGLDIGSSTVKAHEPPESDIYCVSAKVPCYFELGEVVMQEVAKNASIAAKKADNTHGGHVSTVQPLLALFRNKCGKTYETNGCPLHLLMHFNIGHQYPIGWRSLKTLLAPGEFEASQFESVFIYNGWEKRVLEVLNRATNP